MAAPSVSISAERGHRCGQRATRFGYNKADSVSQKGDKNKYLPPKNRGETISV
jgi:hypothetical protein